MGLISRVSSRTYRNPVKMGGDESEMSLSEANALRIKLGLQPLGPKASTKVDTENVHSRSINQNDKNIIGVERDEWGRILVPIDNIGDKKQEDKIKEKLDVRKQKREAERLLRVKTLGASTKPLSRKRKVDIEEDNNDDDDDLDMVNWLSTQSSEARKNKRKYDKMEKFYEDMDKAALEKEYDAKDLVGMKIDHDIADIDDEKDMILTLKDKKILDEDAVKDVLQNVNILDMESARINIKNKKQGLDYNPWEDDADDMLEDMMSFGKHSKTLKKYDEIIYGDKAKKIGNDSFKIGEDGEVDLTEVKKREALKADLLKNTQSLGTGLPEYEPVSDFLTPADFKNKKKYETVKKEAKSSKEAKVPKIKKVKKRIEKLRASDLLGESQQETDGFSNKKINRKKVKQSSRRRVEEDEFDKVAFASVKKNEEKLGKDLLDIDNKIV